MEPVQLQPVSYHNSQHMAETPAEATPDSAASSFPFDRLPREIQLLVLEAALPPQRIFHVSGEQQRGGGGGGGGGIFTFYVRHAPPVALSVCRAARAAVLRRGIFLDGAHGAFFLPAVDMLYFDRSHRRHLKKPPPQSTPDNDAAWATVVQHVGIEWRALFARTPRHHHHHHQQQQQQQPLAVENEECAAAAGWRAALEGLRARMPALRTVAYVLPMVRHPGGLTWGREPYGAQRHSPRLVPLPKETRVPWGDSLVMHELPPPQRRAAPLALPELLRDARKSYLVPWGQMSRMIEDARRCGEDKEGRGWGELDLKGYWLLRADAVYDEHVTSFQS